MSTTKNNFLVLSDHEGQFYAINILHLNRHRIVEDENGSFKKHITKNLVDNTTSHEKTPTGVEGFNILGIFSEDFLKVTE